MADEVAGLGEEKEFELPPEVVDQERMLFEDLEVPYMSTIGSMSFLRRLGIRIAGEGNMKDIVEGVANTTVGPFRNRITKLGCRITNLEYQIDALNGEIDKTYKPKIEFLEVALKESESKIGKQLAVLRAVSKYALVNKTQPTNFAGFYNHVEDIYRFSSKNSPPIRGLGFGEFVNIVNEMVNSGMICYIANESGFNHIGIPIVESLENDIWLLLNEKYFKEADKVSKVISKIGQELVRQVRLTDTYRHDLEEEKKRAGKFEEKAGTYRHDLDEEKKRADKSEETAKAFEKQLAEIGKEHGAPATNVAETHAADEDMFLIEAMGVYMQLNAMRKKPSKDNVIRICLANSYGLDKDNPAHKDRYAELYNRLETRLDGLVEKKNFFEDYHTKRLAFFLPQNFRY